MWDAAYHLIVMILNDPELAAVAKLVIGSLIAAGVSRSTWLKEHETQIMKAKDAVAAGAVDLYPVVKALKAANDDNKLTDAQRAEVKDRSLERSIEIGKHIGVDVVKVLGPALMHSVLEQTVSHLKSGSTVKLSPDVAALLPDEIPRAPKAE